MWCSLTIVLILINILQISLQLPDQAMEELKEFKLRDLFDKLRLSDKEFENWFKELNLLHTQRVCECGKAMCYKWIKNRRNPLWICNWRKNHNGKQPSKGFYEGTFFADSHLSIKQVFEFTYYWVRDTHKQKDFEFDMGISRKIIVDWKSFCRDICIDWFVKTPIQIDKSGCSENGCFSVFWEKIFGPKMRKLIKSKFLDFKEETLEDLEEFGEKRCHCGKYSLKEMQKIKYGDWHFRVSPDVIGQGLTSNIFHAHAMSNLRDFDGKSLKLEKCVALKSVLLEIEEIKNVKKEMLNEVEILKSFARINSKHVIRLYAFKDLSESLPRQLLFLMEMGEYNLREEFENMGKIMENIWLTNKKQSEKLIEFEEIIKNKLIGILQAVKEMHKSVIHLDLKPENMLFVNEEDGKGGNKMTLKIIDFGGSEFIPKNSEIEVEKRANVCEFRWNMVFTAFYASPEQRKRCTKTFHRNEYEFSTKSDIWAVGVMLLEMITYAPMFKNGIGGINAIEAIELITNMFKSGYYDLSDIDIEKQKTSLRIILVILRDKFSQLFSKILKATVNKMPTKRTSARGLLEFLAGNCHLKLLQEKIKFKSNPQQYIEREYVEVTIFGQNSQQKPLRECDQETTGNPLALSDEVNSKESEIMEENIVS